MKSVIWGFLLIHHKDSEGRAVWHQAGVSQVGVLGGTKIPTGIRGSGVFHSGEQHAGVPAERGKLKQRWRRFMAPQCGAALGLRHQPWD